MAHEAVIPGSFSALTAAGDVDVLILEAPLGRRIRLVHGGGPSLQLTAVPLDSEHGALGWQEVFPALAPGQSLEARLARLAPFALSVETSSLAGAYRLDVDVPLTVCGDGVADENEDCDDGNLTSGDGCSAACAREDSDETEPNDEALRADVLSLSPAQGFLRRNEEDWFVFDVGPAQVGAWSFLASDADGLGCSVDLRLSLVDANGREVMVDDGGGLGCPDLLGPATFLNLGTWYVRVSPGTGRRLPPWGAYRLSSSAPP
ncbi:MAG: myxococcus cysteine-rich repeat containing protein [Myxococcota bacterium]